MTCDARTATPVVVTVPRADARPELLEVRFLMPVTGGRPYEFSASIRGDYTQVFFGAVEPDRSVAGFRAMVAVTLSAADAAYFLGWQTLGRMPTRPRRPASSR